LELGLSLLSISYRVDDTAVFRTKALLQMPGLGFLAPAGDEEDRHDNGHDQHYADNQSLRIVRVHGYPLVSWV
jgi:hypothetical protein